MVDARVASKRKSCRGKWSTPSNIVAQTKGRGIVEMHTDGRMDITLMMSIAELVLSFELVSSRRIGIDAGRAQPHQTFHIQDYTETLPVPIDQSDCSIGVLLCNG